MGHCDRVRATRALLVRDPWAGLIVDGLKVWELRGSRTSVRGRIAIARSGSGTLIGSATLVDVIGPIPEVELPRDFARHWVKPDRAAQVGYERVFAWVMSDAVRYSEPIRYTHPPGAVIWVKLDGRRSWPEPGWGHP